MAYLRGQIGLMLIVGLYGAAWWIAVRRATRRLHASQYLVNSAAGTGSQPRLTAQGGLKLAAAFALGCASIWLLYWLFFGVSPLSVISAGSRLAFESTTGNRSYGVWLLGNPVDFLVFLGFPIAILLIYSLLKRIPFPRPLWPIAIATFGTLVVLWLSGIVRGEVGRLWSYFGPLLILIAVAWTDAGSELHDDTHHDGTQK